MADVSIWSGVGVAIQSALGSSQSVTGITKASPAVVTYVGADPANGDYIKLTATGMNEMNARVVRVANVNTGSNTFEAEGVDSTLYGTFATGSMEPVTFGTTISTLTGGSASGGDPNFIDTTTIHDLQASQIPGVTQPATYSFESIWDPADAGLVALNVAADAKAQRCVRFTFANGKKMVFVGYVSCGMLPVGNAQDKVTTPVVFTMYGRLSVFSS